jgi:hypothetical protein
MATYIKTTMKGCVALIKRKTIKSIKRNWNSQLVGLCNSAVTLENSFRNKSNVL